MRNKGSTATTTIEEGLRKLTGLLPADWLLTWEFEPVSAEPVAFRPDARALLRLPTGRQFGLLIEFTAKLEPRDVERLVIRLKAQREFEADAILVVAPFLTERTQALLADQGLSYLDATGNAMILLRDPVIFVRTLGNAKNPKTEKRPLQSLKGRAAGRAVRAFVDFKPPYGTRELATRSNTPAHSLSRVASILEREALLTREAPRGRITNVDWEGTLRLWAQDYAFAGSNNVRSYIDPRGLDSVLGQLETSDLRYAISGSLAVRDVLTIAESRLGVIYVENVELAARSLLLRPAESGANVLLAEPYDSVVFDRVRTVRGIRTVALSQAAVDLLTGPGRTPSEGEALLKWMAAHEDDWRV